MNDPCAKASPAWAEVARDRPLQDLDTTDFYLLYERWIWADHLRASFYRCLADAEGGGSAWDDRGPIRAHEQHMFMYLWYSLLYALLEALSSRGVLFSGSAGADVAYVQDRLRLTRNAVLHVPEPGSLHDGTARLGPNDERLTRLMLDPSSFDEKGRLDPELARRDEASVGTISRIHAGLECMMLTESRARHPKTSPP